MSIHFACASLASHPGGTAIRRDLRYREDETWMTPLIQEFLSEKAQGHLSKGTTGKPTEAAPASPPQQDRVIHVISGGSEICGSQAKTSAPGYGRNKLHGQGTKKGSHPTSRRPGHIAHYSELPGEKHTGR
ncbi:hypothetical protein F2Q70_00011747 [Brassica cretica]|uniref:Uncharacterized protein n=1 Tax=Brassica cretica TaxID=69181 RepID=A0A8S9MA50_BRACR|nr:hypothetical protein F2Q70_00011747 [Brassica cretica]